MNKKNVLLGDYPSVLEVETKDHRVVIVGDTHISGGKYPEDGKFMATEKEFHELIGISNE